MMLDPLIDDVRLLFRARRFAGSGVVYSWGTNFTHTGAGTSATIPVGVNPPDFWSIAKTTMLSLFWLATRQNLPLGSILKLRGSLIFSAWWPAAVNSPLSGLTVNT